jgi:uncharacterized membrane protein
MQAKEENVLYLMIILRLVHVLAGTFWVGGALLLTFFVEPTVRAMGEEGGKFMQRLSSQTKLTSFMTLAGVLTSLAGVWLIWKVSGGLRPTWITSGFGLGMIAGSVAAGLALAIGFMSQGRATARMAVMGQEMQAAGGPPSPEYLAELQSLQNLIRRGGRIGAILLSLSTVLMAISRYL